MREYDFGSFTIKAIPTYHDVQNTSYLINFKPTTVYYATDTNRLDYLDCLRNLNYYFVENNYNEEELNKRIEEKMLNDEYSYEFRVRETHMSNEEINKFLMEMMGNKSQFVYCHQHVNKNIEKEEKENESIK